MADITERLRSSEPLPWCPYDSRSPEYRTAPNDKPCKVCGGLNDSDAPDLCRGADTRIMGEAADEIDQLRRCLLQARCPVDGRGFVDTCIESGSCGCTNGLKITKDMLSTPALRKS